MEGGIYLEYDYRTVKNNEKMSILNGISSTILTNLTNNYFALFAIGILGATNYQVSLINSLPALAGAIISIPSAIIVSKLEEKKKITSIAVFFTRFFLLLMAFVPFLPHGFSSWIFILLIALMNAPGTFVSMSWQAMIGDMIPEERRNIFFGTRNKVTTFVGMVTTLIVGVAMLKFDPKNPIPYQFIFFLAFIFGLFEIFYLQKHMEGKKKITSSGRINILSKSIFKHKPYLYFLICGLFFNFAWQMAWSLFNIYQVKNAHANALWISLIVVANQLAQVLTFTWWGKMASKHGNVLMLVVVCVGMATSPVLTILSTNLIYLVVVNFTTGAFVSGTVLLLFNALLEFSKEEERTLYIANYNFLLAFIAFLAPQFGVFLLDAFGMNESMIVSSLFRFFGGVLFLIMMILLKKKK